ncbi:hypothetical protein BSKO_09165 [Bryopsis sp. KO-2023]|nr:hypothetical protein BSKO_09165 [Bryopsis sp. KO-2023]
MSVKRLAVIALERLDIKSWNSLDRAILALGTACHSFSPSTNVMKNYWITHLIKCVLVDRFDQCTEVCRSSCLAILVRLCAEDPFVCDEIMELGIAKPVIDLANRGQPDKTYCAFILLKLSEGCPGGSSMIALLARLIGLMFRRKTASDLSEPTVKQALDFLVTAIRVVIKVGPLSAVETRVQDTMRWKETPSQAQRVSCGMSFLIGLLSRKDEKGTVWRGHYAKLQQALETPFFPSFQLNVVEECLYAMRELTSHVPSSYFAFITGSNGVDTLLKLLSRPLKCSTMADALWILTRTLENQHSKTSQELVRVTECVTRIFCMGANNLFTLPDDQNSSSGRHMALWDHEKDTKHSLPDLHVGSGLYSSSGFFTYSCLPSSGSDTDKDDGDKNVERSGAEEWKNWVCTMDLMVTAMKSLLRLLDRDDAEITTFERMGGTEVTIRLVRACQCLQTLAENHENNQHDALHSGAVRALVDLVHSEITSQPIDTEIIVRTSEALTACIGGEKAASAVEGLAPIVAEVFLSLGPEHPLHCPLIILASHIAEKIPQAKQSLPMELILSHIIGILRQPVGRRHVKPGALMRALASFVRGSKSDQDETRDCGAMYPLMCFLGIESQDDIVHGACVAIESICAANKACQDEIIKEGGVGRLVSIIKCGADKEPCQAAAVALSRVVDSHPAGQNELRKCGGLEVLVAILRAGALNPVTSAACCALEAGCKANYYNQTSIHDCDGVLMLTTLVRTALLKERSNSSRLLRLKIIASASGAIGSLVEKHRINLNTALKEGVVDLLCQALSLANRWPCQEVSFAPVADAIMCICLTIPSCQASFRKKEAIVGIVDLLRTGDEEMVESGAAALGAISWQNPLSIVEVIECGGIEALIGALKKGQDPCQATMAASIIIETLLRETQFYSRSLDHHTPLPPALITCCLPHADIEKKLSQEDDSIAASWCNDLEIQSEVSPGDDGNQLPVSFPPSFAHLKEKIKLGLFALYDESFSSFSLSRNKSLDSSERRKAGAGAGVRTKQSRMNTSSQDIDNPPTLTRINTSAFLSALKQEKEILNDALLGMKLVVALVLFELCLSSSEVRDVLKDILANGVKPLANELRVEKNSRQNSFVGGLFGVWKESRSMSGTKSSPSK